MRKLASKIRDNLDTLAEEYDRRLQEIEDYAELSDSVRLDAARNTLNLIAAHLESGDEAEFFQCIQAMRSERLGQELTVESPLQALTALKEILLPLVTTSKAAKFLWCAFSRAHTIASHQATETLRESEQKFRQLVDRSPVGIFRTTPDGRIVEANPAFLRIVGYDSLETINQVGVPSLYQDPAEREQVLTLLQQGPISGYETRFRRADGRIIFVSITSRMIYDEEGSPQFLEGIIEDITERKQAEEALRKQREEYQVIFDSAPAMIWYKDAENRILRLNTAAAESMGLPVEEVEGRSVYELNPDEAEHYHQDDLEVIISGKPKLGIIEPLQTASGEYRWLQTDKIPYGDEQGNITGVIVFAVDITERRQAEEALRKSEEKYRDLFENANDLVQSVASDGSFLYVNRAWRDTLGYSEEEISNLSVFDIIHPDSKAHCMETFQRVMTGESIDRVEAMFITRDGRTIAVEGSINCNFEDGIPVATRAIFRNITERKQAEEALLGLGRAVEQSIDGIAIADMEANIQFVNPAWAQMHGYSMEELLGEHLSIFHTEEQLQEEVIPFNEQVMEFGARQGEVGHVRKDGTTFPTWMTTTLLKDEKGNPVGLVGTARDITGRKQLEHEREELLERRAEQVRTGTEVAQEIAAAPALDELFHRVVTLVKERFGYYHAQIFRYEPAVNAVVLVVGYGEAGEEMLTEGHRLEMGHGVVGTAAATGQPVLAADVTQDKDWVPNPHLPETKGELAVPIKLRDQVLGILDVQSDRAGTLAEDDQILLEGLCGQIAIAIEDTRLHQDMEDNLRELERLYRAMSREGWEALRKTKELPSGYLFDGAAVRPADDYPEEHRYSEEHRPMTVAPMLVRDEAIGALGVYDDPQHPMSPDELALVESVSEQVALALESARLFEQTQAALAEIETLYAGSERVARATTMDDVLQALIHSTALQRLDRVSIAFFNRPWENGMPEEATIVATWERSGQESRAPVGTCYSLAQFPAIETVTRNKPAIFRDIATDEHVNENLRTLLLDRLGMRSLILWPLVAGGQWIGILTGQAGTALEIDEDDVRRVTSLADQAAAVIQNQRLFEQAQQRAAELEEATTFLDSIVENMPTMLFVKEAEDLRFVRWNRAGEELVGFSREDMIGKNDYDFFTKEEADFFVAKDHQVLAEGKLEDIPEEPIHTADKGIRLLHTRKVPILGPDGQPKYLLGISEDITERKVAEEALRASEERFGLAVRGSNDGIWDWDIQNNSLYWSPRLKELLGYAEDELDIDFDTFDSLLHPDDREHTGAAIETYLRDRGFYEVEQRLRTKSGEYRWFLARGQAIWDEAGQPLRMVGFTTDITERKQAEAERGRLLAELEATHRAYLRREWRDYLSRREVLRERGLLYDQVQVTPVPDLWRPEMARALAEGDLVTVEDGGDEEVRTGLAIPITLRGQTIGILGVEDPEGARHWSEQDQDLMRAIGQQLGLALENARLLEEAQARAARERLVADITTRVRASTEVDTILRTSIRELGRALRVSDGLIRLGPDDGDGSPQPEEGVEDDGEGREAS